MSAPTYPGVYLEEIPSGVRTITGAATSVAAFVGRALRGPVNRPVTITSFGQFEQHFGGLWLESSLGYAIADFFVNGGGQAIVVRLFESDAGENADTALLIAGEDDNRFEFKAGSPGAWGADLRIRLDAPDAEVSETIAAQYDLPAHTLFNLRIRDLGTGRQEFHQNLTIVSTHARSAQRILENQSELLRCTAMPTPREQLALPFTAELTGTDPWWSEKSSPLVPTTSPSDGVALKPSSFIGPGTEANKTGLYSLDRADLFNLLCLPPYAVETWNASTLWQAAAAYCERKRALLLVDPNPAWTDSAQVNATSLPISTNAAMFFPSLLQVNPLRENQVEVFAPCGAVAGVIARTDNTRGIWKAPAGLDATLKGTSGLSVPLTDQEIGRLNPLGINCLRTAPAAGRVVWGARTLRGDDRLASEWKYIPVRRLALYIEETLYRGTQWAVFEPNDEPLWAQLRLNIGTFMHGLFRKGAFQGSTPSRAYFVQCDQHTTTAADAERGIVQIMVGFAPLKPAEFVVIKLQQIAGQGTA